MPESPPSTTIDDDAPVGATIGSVTAVASPYRVPAARYTSAAWAGVVELLNAGRLDLSGLVTHRFPLGDYAAAIDALRHPSGSRGKVLVEIAAGSGRSS